MYINICHGRFAFVSLHETTPAVVSTSSLLICFMSRVVFVCDIWGFVCAMYGPQSTSCAGFSLCHMLDVSCVICKLQTRTLLLRSEHASLHLRA